MRSDGPSIPMETKRHVLESFEDTHLRKFLDQMDPSFKDLRCKSKGIARHLASKRSLSLAAIVAAMTEVELKKACERLDLPRQGDSRPLATCLIEELTKRTPRMILREMNRRPLEPVCREIKVKDVIDGDTVITSVQGLAKLQTIRLRGIDTPEMSHGEAVAEEREDVPMDETRPLGIEARQRLTALLNGRRVYAWLQPKRGRKGEYVAHRGYRLIAYLALDSPDGQDVGETLLREGFALVWTGCTETKRYLHPRQERYVGTCHAALHAGPGFWGKGLERLCPCFLRKRAPWSIGECMQSCTQSRGGDKQ